MDSARQRQIASAVGACIARRRQEAGFTQEEAAAELDIGNEAVSRMERGVAAPTLGRLFEFADLYGCRVDELLLEASDRDTDQAAAIAHQIAGLSPWTDSSWRVSWTNCPRTCARGPPTSASHRLPQLAARVATAGFRPIRFEQCPEYLRHAGQP